MSPRYRFAGAVAVFALLVLASSLVGVPLDAKGKEKLPGVALDWRLLFHVLRASALLGALATVALVAWRGSHGDWPIKFGNVAVIKDKQIGRVLAVKEVDSDRVEVHVLPEEGWPDEFGPVVVSQADVSALIHEQEEAAAELPSRIEVRLRAASPHAREIIELRQGVAADIERLKQLS